MRIIAFFLLFLGLVLPVSAVAQERPDLTRFKAFADPLVGTWTVTIKDWQADGKIAWEGTQKRAFAYMLADEFLEERALVKSGQRPQDIVTGLHLMSYDPKRNLLFQQGFWPGHAGVLFTVEAALAADNHSASGHIAMPGEQGARKRRRIELRWQNPNELSYRAFAQDNSGKEYLNEELIYRRVQ
ncbi:MAG: hypothetical protein ABIS23_00025 [Sphingomicrobium sp.]